MAGPAPGAPRTPPVATPEAGAKAGMTVPRPCHGQHAYATTAGSPRSTHFGAVDAAARSGRQTWRTTRLSVATGRTAPAPPMRVVRHADVTHRLSDIEAERVRLTGADSCAMVNRPSRFPSKPTPYTSSERPGWAQPPGWALPCALVRRLTPGTQRRSDRNGHHLLHTCHDLVGHGRPFPFIPRSPHYGPRMLLLLQTGGDG